MFSILLIACAGIPEIQETVSAEASTARIDDDFDQDGDGYTSDDGDCDDTNPDVWEDCPGEWSSTELVFSSGGEFVVIFDDDEHYTKGGVLKIAPSSPTILEMVVDETEVALSGNEVREILRVDMVDVEGDSLGEMVFEATTEHYSVVCRPP